MDSEDLFWSMFCKLSTVVLCVSIISVASCMVHRNQSIKEIVLNGESPQRAACAYGVDSTSYQCAILSAK